MKILAGSLSALLLATLVPGRTLEAGTSCEAVSALSLPNATITLAQAVEAGSFTPPAASQRRGSVSRVCRHSVASLRR